jgi:hypothetical protein
MNHDRRGPNPSPPFPRPPPASPRPLTSELQDRSLQFRRKEAAARGRTGRPR